MLGKKNCFLCKVKLGFTNGGYSIHDYETNQISPPENMTESDELCKKCWKEDSEEKKNAKKQLDESIKEEGKKFHKELIDSINSREPEYKAKWNKGGVIEYKDEKCAILHRIYGAQVQFIIAFSDLTKEGYKLMVQDEGKTASTGGLTGGVDSYYYFQKFD